MFDIENLVYLLPINNQAELYGVKINLSLDFISTKNGQPLKINCGKYSMGIKPKVT